MSHVLSPRDLFAVALCVGVIVGIGGTWLISAFVEWRAHERRAQAWRAQHERRTLTPTLKGQVRRDLRSRIGRAS